MSERKDPTKPVPNDEKFKPQNVADGGKSDHPANRHREKPGDTGGYDIERGSDGQTKQTPSR